jgi:hypothetical protein
MHKNVTKCNETLSKWCKNKHGASKIIDTFDTYQEGHVSSGEPRGIFKTKNVQSSAKFRDIYIYRANFYIYRPNS